jgi:hypothetical protein
MKCGYERGSAAYTDSEPDCATGIPIIYNFPLSEITVEKNTNYSTSIYTGFFIGNQNTLPPNHISTFSGTKFLTIHLPAELIKTANMCN